jgi:hypothetical protein
MSDLDTHDLYPPDVEPDELTPAAREHRKRVVVGTALVVWGTSLLIQRALGVDLDTFWLGIGLAALAGWTAVRRYQWFVAGSIISGLGVGELLSGPLDNAFGATLSLLCIAAGFAAVYVRYPRRSSWALPFAAVFTLIAVGALGIGLIGLVPAVLGRFLLPLLLIGGGALLLARHSLPPKTVRAGLAALAVAFVLVGATSVPDIDHGPPIDLDHFGPMTGAQPLELYAGEALSMVTDGSGSIEFRVGPEAMITFDDDGRRGGPGLDGRREPGRLILGEDGFFSNDESRDVVITLPPGIELDIARGSGSITGVLSDATGSIRTGSGDVDLVVQDGDGPLEVETDSGDVRVRGEVRFDLDVESDDGEVVVDGQSYEGEFESASEARGFSLDVDTESGDVDIRQVDGPTPPTAPTAPTAPTPPTAPTLPS